MFNHERFPLTCQRESHSLILIDYDTYIRDGEFQQYVERIYWWTYISPFVHIRKVPT